MCSLSRSLLPWYIAGTKNGTDDPEKLPLWNGQRS